jgi:hypothetical protein
MLKRLLPLQSQTKREMSSGAGQDKKIETIKDQPTETRTNKTGKKQKIGDCNI